MSNNILQQLLLQAMLQNLKMDICFYNAVQRVKKSAVIKIFCHFLSYFIFIVFTVFIFISYDKSIQLFLIIAPIVSSFLFQTIKYINYKNCLCNVRFMMIIAKQTNHTVNFQQDLSFGKQQYVSGQMYNAVTDIKINDPALTKQMCYQNQTQNVKIIQIISQKSAPCGKFLSPLNHLLTLAYFIYAIVFLINNASALNAVEISYISFILFVGFINVFTFIIGLVIVFIALFAVFFLCIKACCCCCFIDNEQLSLEKKNSLGNLPQVNNGGNGRSSIIAGIIGESCSICKMDFDLGDSTITLRCNQKHVFHENCIKTWVRINPTCPTCRTPI